MGSKGVEKIIELELTEEERRAFEISTEEVFKMIKILKEASKV